MNSFRKIHRLLLKAENLILTGLLLSMIVIAVAQILLRNVFGGGLLWADAYTRTCVLWIALVGAMLASRQQKHIVIDVFTQYLPTPWKILAQKFSLLSTALVCLAAAWFSLVLVMQEYQFGETAFGIIPNWWCQSIIPVAFMLIASRYFIAMFIANAPDAGL